MLIPWLGYTAIWRERSTITAYLFNKVEQQRKRNEYFCCSKYACV